MLQCGHDPNAVENYTSWRRKIAELVRFNAATTRRPWRTRHRRPRRTGCGCFNAATTRRPWRTRPPPAPTTRAATRCFNAATTRRPWRTPGRTRGGTTGCGWSSCGHDPKAVENYPPGPSWMLLTASLQCGHGPKAVESSQGLTRCRLGTSHALQCGHGPKAVENYSVVRACRPVGSFNAATARRPWRTAGAPPAGSFSFNAATARRPWRTSGLADPGQTLCNGSASMRPRPEGRGELVHRG